MRDFLEYIADHGDLETGKGRADTADPVSKARAHAKTAYMKRFYDDVYIEVTANGWAILLDNHKAKTPSRNVLELPSQGLAEHVRNEWQAQEEVIDPSLMPMTRLANTVLDGVRGYEDDIRFGMHKLFEADLLTYRASEPGGLVANQQQYWDPLIEMIKARHGVQINLMEGVVFNPQPAQTIEKLVQELTNMDAWQLAAFHTMASLTSSALIALCLYHQDITLDEAWCAAHVDEDWTNTQWGKDAEAMAVRAFHFNDFEAAHNMMSLS